MIMRMFLCLCLGFFATAQAASAQPVEPGQCYALLVGGLAGQEPYSRWYSDWLARFQAVLTKSNGVPAANVTVLSGDAATADAITAAIGKFSKRSKPQDQFILFIVGHGEITQMTPTLTLRGPDLTVQQLADALSGLQAKSQVILNFSASSGDCLKTLASPNRVNITATSPTELEEPVFAEFFLRGLESKQADTDKNGTITMLEAYNWTEQQTALWISRWQLTSDIHSDGPTVWKASGKETIEIFEKLYAGLTIRKLDSGSDRTAADAVVDVVPPGGQVTEDWSSRRVVDEHALLEDCGQAIGVSGIGDKGLQPILGQKSGDPGYLATHTILGQPAQANP